LVLAEACGIISSRWRLEEGQPYQLISTFGKETLNKLEAEASSFSSWLPSNDMELKELDTFVKG
jgi:hypothetical protein